ncbi:MAG: M13 family metallopeptidase, partial [Bacteroidota bacterium]|nr:M13 family metallopeptidase [Bacteroidota bacterium]
RMMIQKSGINTGNFDKATQPGKDFYTFVNGGWMERTAIPADRSSWGSFHELSKETDIKVLSILKAELSEDGPSANIAGRLYESGMDKDNIESRGLSTLNSFLQKINALDQIQQLPALIAHLTTEGLGAFLQFSVHPDLGNSKKYAAYLEPGAQGLPERDFYLDEDDKAKLIREKYIEYIQKILVEEAHFSEDISYDAANNIFEVEKNLASRQMSKEDRRQLDKIYNPFTIEEVQTRYSDWNWNQYFDSLGVDSIQHVIVTDPGYFDYFITTFQSIPLIVCKQYLTFLLIHHSAPYAHSSLEELHFDLFSKTLDGVEVMRPREERMVKTVNQLLGEALGELFVSRHFPAHAKVTALEMVDDIIDSFTERIAQLTWMSEATKSYALQKLQSFKVKIGYPDKWKDYAGLEIQSGENGNFLSNILHTVQWKYAADLKKIGSEVDLQEWFMAPQVVNAYYNPMFNEIVFPAAILQPPFFDWEADAAANYGGIGAVIGHEITHGFDDQGSRFDKEGNYKEWWTTDDRDKFAAHTAQLVEQFDAYKPFDDLPLNGTFTLGENIADLGGLSVAYDALQLYYKRHGTPPVIDGYTADQRFFISWATVWRTKIRPEALRTQIKTDPHPPGLFRAVAAPSNMDSFYVAFDIESDSPWYRSEEERIKIW